MVVRSSTSSSLDLWKFSLGFENLQIDVPDDSEEIAAQNRLNDERELSEIAISKYLSDHQFLLGGIIGHGTFGTVYKITNFATNEERAFKREFPFRDAFSINDPAMQEFGFDPFRADALCLQLDHPNLQKPDAILYWQEGKITEIPSKGALRIAMILPLLGGPSLTEKIGEGLLPSEILQIAFELADGLQAAHKKGIVHRDLKPSNIKFDKNGRPVVIDFGCAKNFFHEQSKTPVGTFVYQAPEAQIGRPLEDSAKMDVWAMGLVIKAMLRNQLLPQIDDLLARMLVEEPTERCTMEEVANTVSAILSII